MARDDTVIRKGAHRLCAASGALHVRQRYHAEVLIHQQVTTHTTDIRRLE